MQVKSWIPSARWSWTTSPTQGVVQRPIFRVSGYFYSVLKKITGFFGSPDSICLIWGSFLRNIEDLEYISLWKFTLKKPTFYLLFESRNLGGKSCNSLVSDPRSSLDKHNCNGWITNLNTQKQPLFWDKSNKNFTLYRHLQTATKLDKMSPIIGDAKYIGVCHTLG